MKRSIDMPVKAQIELFIYDLLTFSASLLVCPSGVYSGRLTESGIIKFNLMVNYLLDKEKFYNYWHKVEAYKNNEDVFIKLGVEASKISDLLEKTQLNEEDFTVSKIYYGFLQVDIYTLDSQDALCAEADRIFEKLSKVCENGKDIGSEADLKLINIAVEGVRNFSSDNGMCERGSRRMAFHLHYIIKMF